MADVLWISGATLAVICFLIVWACCVISGRCGRDN